VYSIFSSFFVVVVFSFSFLSADNYILI